ncbi:unnamed protein product [Paramecium pentaurelia]|uniref:Uncharacterized protein n=1 Tax=Paramecium pentaurelia TaxID=43138 RepID=A0A8S1VKF7_9CILI|nr:unnamed protein product [Paramecium pentaurelia]
MRNSTLNKLSEQRQQGKNSSNLSDLTVQESSNYRLRFTPLTSPSTRHKGTILMKSHETIVLNMLSSTHRQIDQPFKFCQECNSEIGMVHQYCKCRGITYHEKCIQDTARRNAKKQKEQAFICKNECSYPFQIEGYYMYEMVQNQEKHQYYWKVAHSFYSDCLSCVTNLTNQYFCLQRYFQQYSYHLNCDCNDCTLNPDYFFDEQTQTQLLYIILASQTFLDQSKTSNNSQNN